MHSCRYVISLSHFIFNLLYIYTANVSSSGGVTSSTAVIGGLIGGIVLLIALIALVLAVIIRSRRLQKKQTDSINPEIFNDSHSKL